MRVALMLLLVASCSGPLDRKRLHGEIEELQSIASETKLVLELTVDGPTAYSPEQRVGLEPALAVASSLAERLHPALVNGNPRELPMIIDQLESLEYEVRP